MPKLLARIHIGDVHLDQGRAQLRAGVSQRHRRVRQPTGVEDHRFFPVGGQMDPVQQLSLAVTLPHNDFQSELGGLAFDQRDQIVVGGVAVDLRFAAAEPTEVGPVDDVDRASSNTHLRVGRRQQRRVRTLQPAGLGQAVEHHEPQHALSGSSCRRPCTPAVPARRRRRSRPASPATSGCCGGGRAVASSSRPASRPSSAANTKPTETAAPWRHW